MKAAIFEAFGDPEVLHIVDVPAVHPKENEIRIKTVAAGINESDFKKRRGLMDKQLPQTLGYEAAGIVDEIGEKVSGIKVGEQVFGFNPYGAAQAESVILSKWVPLNKKLNFITAAALPVVAETATRALDQLNIKANNPHSKVILINGASGNIGSAATQIAVYRGARVIGVCGLTNFQRIRLYGATPVSYGRELSNRVKEIAPEGIDCVLDIAGNGILPELVSLTGSADRVVTITDYLGAKENAVKFSTGDTGRAEYALDLVAKMSLENKFSIPVGKIFSFEHIVEAHKLGESGKIKGKLILSFEKEL